MKQRGPWLVLMMVALIVGLASAQAQGAEYSPAASRVAEKLVQAFPKVRGLIVSVEPQGKLVVDLTAKDGIYPGLEMEIFREGEPFKHPASGEVMGRMEKTVASLRVVEVRERYAVAELLDKEMAVKQGDGVRVTGARILLGLAKVESPPGGEIGARTLSREIEVALGKTGRFEVFDDRIMRSTLVKAGLKEVTRLTDPAALEVLQKGLRLSAVAIPKLATSSEGDQVLDVELVSARTAAALKVVSTEIGKSQTMVTQAAPLEPSPSAPPKSNPSRREEGPTPAWIGRPEQRQGQTGGFVEPQVYTVIIPHPIQLIKAGRITGQGSEMVGASRDHVYVYRWVGREPKLILDYGQSNPSHKILSLSVADINGNGRDEVFVTQIESVPSGAYGITNRLKSYVLEFDGTKLVPIWENVPLHLRAMTVGDQQYLIAQRMGESKPYQGLLRQVVWQGDRYVEKGPFPLPDGVDIYGFTLGDLDGDGRAEIIKLSGQGVVQVFDSESGKYSGGSQGGPYGGYVHIDFEQYDPKRAEIVTSSAMAKVALATRVIPGELKAVGLGDRGRGVVVPENMGGLLAQYRERAYPKESRLVFLAWQAGGLRPVCQTRHLERYTADFDIADMNGDGEPEILLLTLEPQYQLLGGYQGEAWLDVLYLGACR